MKFVSWKTLGIAGLALALAAPASAYRGRDWTDWGAIAIGPGGAYSLALHYDSERDARAAALARCGGRCDRTLPFHDSCAAIAIARKGLDYWAVGPTRDEASRRAEALCTEQASDCRIGVAGCTD